MSGELTAFLRRSGTLTPQELELSLVQATARNVSLWDIVLERQVPEETLAATFSKLLNLSLVRLDEVEIEDAALKTVPGWLARKHTCLPIRLDARKIVLAMANPTDRQTIQDVQFASSRQVQPVVACRSEIVRSIERRYPSADPSPGAAAADATDVETLRVVTADSYSLDLDEAQESQTQETLPAVHLCNQIILDAIKSHASDIHIEPGPRELRVRLRIDGVLRDHLHLPRWMLTALASRIKILARLDIARQRLPQDGRITVTSEERDIDVRVSTLPTHFGEKIVLRLLGSTGAPTLDALGMSAGELTMVEDALRQPQGLILVTGPTGAGKSTTLHSMLMRRESAEVNIVTIEDPIEYKVPGANQVQVDAKAGLTFASCLRAILRQDPDVIMVGEIRDLETAEIAFQAALTGHVVFSTLHTNSSVATIERFLDLGVRPLLITGATNLIVAQRLARRICVNCREPYVPSAEALRNLRIQADSQEFVHGKGCEACGRTGYSGRVGIFELLRFTPQLKKLVSRRATESKMQSAAISAGTRLLMTDAIEKVRQQLTTPEEIQRVIRIEHADDSGQQGGLSPRRPLIAEHASGAAAPLARRAPGPKG